VRPPYIYVAAGTSFNPLLRIQLGDYNLYYAFPFGALGSTQSTGVFYSPRRFLGLRNNVLIIIDDSGNLNQLISLDYPSFTGWTTAPNSIGFEFYSAP
jgi:hypothetical protein